MSTERSQEERDAELLEFLVARAFEQFMPCATPVQPRPTRPRRTKRRRCGTSETP
jgi:hypothetical protein